MLVSKLMPMVDVKIKLIIINKTKSNLSLPLMPILNKRSSSMRTFGRKIFHPGFNGIGCGYRSSFNILIKGLS